MKSLALFGLVILGSLSTGCGSDTPTTPSTGSPVTFTATLLPGNEVPAVAGAEAGGSGTARVTLNLTKDPAGNVSAATLDVSVSAAGFPPGTALTASHIHAAGAGVNGGIVVSFGLSAGEVTFPNGSGSFTKQGISVPADQANAIVANPAGFYVNIHTAANTNGVARGQLIRAN
jgi:hypothetical protein